MFFCVKKVERKKRKKEKGRIKTPCATWNIKRTKKKIEGFNLFNRIIKFIEFINFNLAEMKRKV